MKIKHIYIACLLALTGCIETVPDCLPEVEVPVTFPSPVVEPTVKAADGPLGTIYSTQESFGVFALYHQGAFNGWTSGSIYIDGAEFSYDASINDSSEGSGAWISSPSYYWPNTGKMTFAAWSPYRAKDYSTSLSYGADGLTISGFHNSDETGRQFDLMYSDRAIDRTKDSHAGTSTTYDGVDIVFHHALSAVIFQARSSITTSKIRVSKIVLYDIVRSGDFSEGTDETDPSVYSSSPSWTLLSSDKYTEDSPLVVYSDNSVSESNVLPSDAASSYPVGCVMPLPQAINAAKLKVYYTVQIGTSDPVPTVSQPVDIGTSVVSGGSEVINSWQMGKKYIYTLVLGAQKISFDVDLQTWQNADPQGI